MIDQGLADSMLTTDEVAQELRCADDPVLRPIKRGDLPAIEYGRLMARPWVCDVPSLVRAAPSGVTL